MGGSFHVIKLEAINRLYSIRAYFSFLARFRAQIKNSDRADYSEIYKDFEDVVDQIFSITKPAFSKTGELLGVVGLNVFVKELPSDIREALSYKSVETPFNASQIAFTAKDADIQNAIILDNPCPSTPISSLNTGLCNQTDFSNKIEKLACCDACSVPKKATKVTLIAVFASVGALVVIAAAITLFFLRRKNKFPFDGRMTIAKPPPKISAYDQSAPNTSPMSPTLTPRMGR